MPLASGLELFGGVFVAFIPMIVVAYHLATLFVELERRELDRVIFKLY